MPKPRLMLDFNVNKLKIRIPWFVELEGEGIIPVVGALLLCLVGLIWLVFR